MNITNFKELLQFLAGPGALVAITWATSWALEEVTWWHELKPKVRTIIIWFLSIILGLGASYVMGNEALLAKLTPAFGIIIGVTGAWLSTQVAYRVKKKGKG